MSEQPEEMTLCQLQVLLMPNGEILCNGRSIGYFSEFNKWLTPEVKDE